MPVSRRGFLRLVGPAEPSPFSAAFLSARGLEAERAEAQAQAQTPAPAPRTPRPALPPGVTEIKISSNENPLGPGKTVLDAILGKFPEAGRVSVQQLTGRRSRRPPPARRVGGKPC